MRVSHAALYLLKLYEGSLERARFKRLQQIVDAVELEGVERILVESRDEYYGKLRRYLSEYAQRQAVVELYVAQGKSDVRIKFKQPARLFHG